MNDGMRLPFENERSWPVQPLWTVFAPIARLADTSLPVLSVSIHSGISDKELSNEERERNVWLSEDRSKYQKVVPGDLVYNSMRAWQGGFGACQTLGLVSPAYGVLSPISTINTKFYELLFRTKGYIALFDTFSPGIIDFRKRLSWDRCKHMKVPVPPLEEQNRIVKFACNVGAKVHLVTQKLQQQLDLLNEYRQSLITRAVTKGLDPNVEMKDSGVEWIGSIPREWKTSKISFVSDVTLGKMLCPRQTDSEQTLETYLCAGSISWDGVKDYIKEMWFSSKEKSELLLIAGDVLVVEGGAGFGMTTLYKGEHSPCYFQNSIIRVRGHHNVMTSDFINYWMRFTYTAYLKTVCNEATFSHYTKEKVSETPILVPPLNEQKKIADFCKLVDERVKTIYAGIENQISKLNEYRSSLISAAVTGQLAIEEAEE